MWCIRNRTLIIITIDNGTTDTKYNGFQAYTCQHNRKLMPVDRMGIEPMILRLSNPDTFCYLTWGLANPIAVILLCASQLLSKYINNTKAIVAEDGIKPS